MRIDSFRQLAKLSIKINWIVDNLISPGGWTFLVGETGTGKSMMTIQLCDALQLGKPFLGLETTQHNCLYLQADSGLIEWQKQIELLAKDSAAWTGHQLERGFLDEASERARIRELVWGSYTPEVQGEATCANLIKGLGGIQFDFIVFDCLHAITNGDLNTKTCMSTVLRHIDEIVTKVTILPDGSKDIQRRHFLLIHHPNAVQKRGATAGSGHKGFSDACSTKLTLGANLLVLEKSKITSKKEIILERDENGGWYKPGFNDRLYEGPLKLYTGHNDMLGRSLLD